MHGSSSLVFEWIFSLGLRFRSVLLCLAANFGISFAAGSLPQFADVTRQAGLSGFVNKQGSVRKDYILESIGGGCAWFDYDRDGWLDIILIRGADLESYAKGGERVCALYRNNRDGKFTDATGKAGLAARGWGMGVTIGDYDADGREDMFVTGYGRNFLFRNKGDGTFSEVAGKAGLLSTGLWSTGAVFFDYDGDGRLDLYVARYVHFDASKPVRRGPGCKYQGMGVFCGPQGFHSDPHSLYRNNGDGTFMDVSEPAGLRKASGPYHGLGVVALDFDNDGRQDLYVANDSTPNLLWRNLGGGRFEEVAVARNVAFSSDGLEQAGMGVEAGDLFNRGLLDLHVTNFSREPNELYRNMADYFFEDITWSSGIGKVTLPYLGWSVHFADFDLDGWQDILTVNGHVYPEVDRAETGTTYRQRLLLFRNLADGRFESVGDKLGAGFAALHAGRGAAVGDYDNDGDLDVLIANIDDPPALLRNTGKPAHNWLQVGLEPAGASSHIGARVYVTAGGLKQMREVRSQSGYLSVSDPRAHFGLGAAATADAVDVVWPDGKRVSTKNVKANQFVRLPRP
ncbi:MAG: CRTAC1 family protein [Bryobacteraceae bacterium]